MDLLLHIPEKDDGWFYVKMMSDPETMAYNAPWFPPDGCIPNPEEEWERLISSWIGCEDKRFYAFLKRKSDGCFVGDVNYHYNPRQDCFDMGIVIYAPERGKGYGKQGLQLLLDRAFRINGISKLRNDFETTRGAAYKIHRSVGFTELETTEGMFLLEMKREDYLRQAYLDDPCQASSLPFWKTLQIKLAENIAVFREDEFHAESFEGIDEPYFKLVHQLEKYRRLFFLKSISLQPPVQKNSQTISMRAMRKRGLRLMNWHRTKSAAYMMRSFGLRCGREKRTG